MTLADLLTSLDIPRSLGFYPRIIRMPEGHRVYLSDTQTVFCTFPELYAERDYELYPGFVAERGWTVLDVGANVGLYSMRAARQVGKEGLVVSLEPNPVSYYWLKKNLELNGMNNVKVYPTAMGSAEGYALFHAGTGNNIRLSSFSEEHIRAAQHHQDIDTYAIRVPVKKLDSFMRTEFGEKTVDLMKVDVEGSELDVFRGTEAMLDSSMIRRIVVEVHLDVVSEEEMCELFSAHNYRVVHKVKQNALKEMLYALPAN
jgi:FkbM family methyltransferase